MEEWFNFIQMKDEADSKSSLERLQNSGMRQKEPRVNIYARAILYLKHTYNDLQAFVISANGMKTPLSLQSTNISFPKGCW